MSDEILTNVTKQVVSETMIDNANPGIQYSLRTKTKKDISVDVVTDQTDNNLKTALAIVKWGPAEIDKEAVMLGYYKTQDGGLWVQVAPAMGSIASMEGLVSKDSLTNVIKTSIRQEMECKDVF